jgi:hypothetical protein
MRDTSGKDRDSFFVHPWGLSEGCIMLHMPNFSIVRDWAIQDNGGTLRVVAEDF